MRRRARRLPRPGCPGSGEEGAAMSKKRLQQLVESLSRSAKHFNRGEVECLIRLFDTLMSASHSRFAAVGFDRNVFLDTLHRDFGMTDDVLMDRVFRIFDRGNDNCISVVEWVEGLSVFLRGTLEERIKYCFEVYDLNGDGYISREEMFQMLKNSLLKQPSEEDPDEGIKDLVDIALKKMAKVYSAVRSEQAVAYSIMCCYVNTLKKTWQKYTYNKTTHIKYFKDDHDHDGKLSFADFEKAVKNENLLLEAFGPCLPDVKSSMAFERRTFQEKRKL